MTFVQTGSTIRRAYLSEKEQKYGDNQNSVTVGPRGPVLMEDDLLFEKMAAFNRKRIPERVVRAKGADAYGMFTVTHDTTKYTSAKMFSEVGKKN